MLRTAPLANVYPLRAEPVPLTVRERAKLDMIDLFLGLDTESQRVLVRQVATTVRRMRRYSRTAELLAGGAVWRRGAVRLWLVAPASRRWLYQRAHG